MSNEMTDVSNVSDNPEEQPIEHLMENRFRGYLPVVIDIETAKSIFH